MKCAPGDEVTCVFTLHGPAQAGTYPLAYRLSTSAGIAVAFSPRQTIVVTPVGPNPTFDNAVLTILQAPISVRVTETHLIIVNARNTGSTTWGPPNYELQLRRTGAIALPQNSAALGSPVPPGQSRAFQFALQGAANPGPGGFSVQVVGPSGAFGQSVGQSVVCRP